jgi:hypothetical protein
MYLNVSAVLSAKMASKEDVKIAIALYSFAQSTNQPCATTGFEVLNNFNVFKVFFINRFFRYISQQLIGTFLQIDPLCLFDILVKGRVLEGDSDVELPLTKFRNIL